MEEPTLALILEECLAALDVGESPEDVAGRYPEFFESLLPLLRLGATLKETAEDFSFDLGFFAELGETLAEGAIDALDLD